MSPTIPNPSASAPPASSASTDSVSIVSGGCDKTDGEPSRRETRCSVSKIHEVPGQFILGSTEAPDVRACELADLSAGGCAVRVQGAPLCEGIVAIVRFTLPQGLTIETAGRICWVRQNSITSQSVGLRFRRELSDDMLAKWIQAGAVSRRNKDRNIVNQTVSLRSSQGECALTSATLVDYSPTGVQLTTSEPVAVDQRVMLTMPDGKGAVCQVVWTSQAGDMHRCGAMFVNRISATTVSNYFENQSKPTQAPPAKFMDRIKRYIGGPRP